MNRNIVEVLEQVKNNIPRSWPTAPFLKEKLVRLQLMGNLAPRDTNIDLWRRGAEYLSTYLDPVDCDWKRRVLVIWLGVYPAPALDIISVTMGNLIDMFEAVTQLATP